MKTKVVSLKSLVITLGLLFTGMLASALLQPAIQYFRYYDQRGINVFETSKENTVAYDGLKLRIGAGFTQGYQKPKAHLDQHIPPQLYVAIAELLAWLYRVESGAMPAPPPVLPSI